MDKLTQLRELQTSYYEGKLTTQAYWQSVAYTLGVLPIEVNSLVKDYSTLRGE